MQETHIIGHDTIIFHDTELKGWQFINSAMKLKSRAGVGLILSPNVKIVDINNIFEGRILLVRLILHGIKLSAFCAYAPTEEYAESSKHLFYNTLQKSIILYTIHDKSMNISQYNTDLSIIDFSQTENSSNFFVVAENKRHFVNTKRYDEHVGSLKDEILFLRSEEK